MIQSLRDAVAGLAQTVLPKGTPAVEAVPAAIQFDNVATRERLQGSIVRCTDGSFLTVPTAASSLGASSKKISLSPTGRAADAKDLSEGQVSAIDIKEVIYGVMTDETGEGAAASAVRVAGLTAVIRAVVAANLTEVAITVEGMPPTDKPADQLDSIALLTWLPWKGAPRAPPPIPPAVGVPLIPAAATTAIGASAFLGEQPALAMRTAQLGLIGLTIGDCANAAQLACGIAETPSLIDAVTVALAISATPTVGAEGPTVTAARAATPPLAAIIQRVIDHLAQSGAQAEVATALAHYSTVMGSLASTQATGTFIAQSIAAADVRAATAASATATAATAAAAAAAAALVTGATVTPPGTLSAAAAAAVALALGGAAPSNPARIEATRRLSASALPPAEMEAAVAALAAALAANGFSATTPPSTAPIIDQPTVPAISPAPTLAALRPAGADSLSPAEVVAAIATVFGKAPIDLTNMLAVAVGRTASDAFFGADADYEAQRAATDFDAILNNRRFEARPTGWPEAARRLRELVDTRGAAPPPPTTANGVQHRGDGSREGTSKVLTATTATTAAVGDCKYSTSVSALACDHLTRSSVVAAEACAQHEPDAIAELARLRMTAYGLSAMPYTLSDGIVTGSMPEKGERHAAPPGRAHIHLAPPNLAPHPPAQLSRQPKARAQVGRRVASAFPAHSPPHPDQTRPHIHPATALRLAAHPTTRSGERGDTAHPTHHPSTRAFRRGQASSRHTWTRPAWAPSSGRSTS